MSIFGSRWKFEGIESNVLVLESTEGFGTWYIPLISNEQGLYSISGVLEQFKNAEEVFLVLQLVGLLDSKKDAH